MFNLIPENLKKEIKKEYSLRRFIVILIFTFFVQTTFLIFIFPTWLISFYKEQEVTLKQDQMNQHLSNLNIASTTEQIKLINNKLSILDKKLEYPRIIPHINAILLNKTDSIYITDISYVTKDAKNSSITLQGKSKTRDTLTIFVRSLQSSGKFKSVDLPISNFTKDKDLVFSINIIIEEPKI